jgi:hypothetical protein
MKFDVFNRWDGTVQFTAEINCEETDSTQVKLGLSVKWALKNGASLDGARLDGARLVGARLDRASLVGASLDGASLDGARLVGARLVGASLDGASLDGARLVGARLDGARLVGARLVGARLVGASLVGASLDGASLVGASLVGARLDRATFNGQSMTVEPIQLSGLYYHVIIIDRHIKIGCEFHSIPDWESFSDRRILDMDGTAAAEFWAGWKELIITIARKHEPEEG